MISRKVLWFLVCFTDILTGLQAMAPEPTTVRPFRKVDNDFQNALQQQTFMSVLTSIEERLKNLDNIYSVQLARSLDVKLEQYNRKLESLDTKIIRLEALVMLNLDKISENISTKNFKDDISRTNIFRKMDTMYEGISHRLSYMDRKYDGNFMKMQEKIDTALIRLERIEDATTRRETEMEASFSEILFTIDDFRTNYSETARKIEKISDTILNNTKDTISLISRYHAEGRKSLSKFHDNIIANLEYIDNKTSEHYKVSDDTNGILKTMRSELKQDFNSYANKVADMNSDMWKNTDVTDEDLKQVAVAVNQTKIEIQNGIRSIMVQIGKIPSKRTTAPTDVEQYTELNKKLDDNFDKILTNQGIFLESCHRLQMDESQIETEISQVLEKLIDMIEIKLAKESKNMKNFETFLKGHDTRVKRNVAQANSNIYTLFQRSMISNEAVNEEIKKIRWDLEGMFTLLHNALHDNRSKSEFERIVNQLSAMDHRAINSMSNITRSLKDVLEAVSTTQSLTLLNYNMLIKTQNTDTDASNLTPSTKSNNNLLAEEGERQNPKRSNQKHNGKTNSFETNLLGGDESIDKAIEEVFGTHNDPQVMTTTPGKIDAGISKAIYEVFGNPEEATEATTIKISPAINKAIEEIFGTPETTTIKISSDINKAIKEVFGTPPAVVTPNPVTPRRCRQNYRHLIDVRGNFKTSDCGDSSTSNTDKTTVHKRGRTRRRKKKQKNLSQIIDLRGNFDSQNATEAEYEYDDDYSEEVMGTEATTEITDSTTSHK